MAVCDYFTNDNRVFRAADALAEQGFDVQLLAYHRDDLSEKETLGHGFQLNRLPLKAIVKKPSQFSNFLKYLDFRRNAKAFADNYQPDVVHCHDYNTLFLGVYCQKKYKTKIVYDNHEYFQDLSYLHRYPKAIRRYIAHYEKETIRYWVDDMIVVSDGIGKTYEKLTGIKPTIVMNITDMSTIPATVPQNDEYYRYKTILEKYKAEQKELLLYVGKNFARGRGMDFSIELLKRLPEKYHLVVFGCSNDREIKMLERIFEERNVNNRISTYKYVSIANLFHLKAYFTYGLSLIEPIYFSYRFSLPNKLFEYMMMGIPVIASDIPEQKNIVETYNIGFVAKLDDPESVAEHMLKMDEMPYYGMAKAMLELNWQGEKKKLLSIYESST